MRTLHNLVLGPIEIVCMRVSVWKSHQKHFIFIRTQSQFLSEAHKINETICSVHSYSPFPIYFFIYSHTHSRPCTYVEYSIVHTYLFIHARTHASIFLITAVVTLLIQHSHHMLPSLKFEHIHRMPLLYYQML